MGLQYRFTCPDCDYTAVVGGGVGTDEMAQLKTIHCLDCGEVYDVPCAELQFDRRNKRAGYSFVPTPSRCPKSADTGLPPTSAPGAGGACAGARWK